jgi:hypothetical protein
MWEKKEVSEDRLCCENGVWRGVYSFMARVGLYPGNLIV